MKMLARLIRKLSATQTQFCQTSLIIKFLEYSSQSMGLGHILPMEMQNNLEDKMMVEETILILY
jgi:hypothetical protein